MPLARCLALLLAIATAAAGEVYEDSLRGFRINYPDSWSVLSRDDISETSDAVKDLRSAAGAESRRDPRVFVATETGVEPPEYAALIAVSITPGRFVIDEAAAEAMLVQMKTVTGPSTEVVSGGIGSLGDNTGLVAEFVAENPLTDVVQRRWKISTTGHQQAYSVVCSAPENEAECYRNVCQEALASFEKDIGIGGFLDGIPAMWKDAFLGVAIVGILQVFVWWKKNRVDNA